MQAIHIHDAGCFDLDELEFMVPRKTLLKVI